MNRITKVHVTRANKYALAHQVAANLRKTFGDLRKISDHEWETRLNPWTEYFILAHYIFDDPDAGRDEFNTLVEEEIDFMIGDK